MLLNLSHIKLSEIPISYGRVIGNEAGLTWMLIWCMTSWKSGPGEHLGTGSDSIYKHYNRDIWKENVLLKYSVFSL